MTDVAISNTGQVNAGQVIIFIILVFFSPNKTADLNSSLLSSGALSLESQAGG